MLLSEILKANKVNKLVLKDKIEFIICDLLSNSNPTNKEMLIKMVISLYPGIALQDEIDILIRSRFLVSKTSVSMIENQKIILEKLHDVLIDIGSHLDRRSFLKGLQIESESNHTNPIQFLRKVIYFLELDLEYTHIDLQSKIFSFLSTF